MSSKHEDQLALAHLALIDMERAQKSIELSQSANDPYLQAALFRDAVISYAKPFLSNRYSDNSKGLRISDNHVPQEFRGAHDEILALRDQLIAHTDMTVQKPKIDKYTGDNGPTYSMSVTGYETIHKDHLVEPLLKLGSAVHRSLMSGRAQQTKNDF
ncbi:MAG: hypothetical protein AB7K24_33280 [Gemmataceae bacterium]